MNNLPVQRLSVGDRIRMENGTAFSIDRLPTGMQTQIRLRQVDGNQTINRSPYMLERMFSTGEAFLMNKPLNEQAVELRLADATQQEFFEFQFRKKVSQDLDSFVAGTSKATQMESVAQITKLFATKARKRGLIPIDLPQYETVKKWQREYASRTNNTKLLVLDYRKNPRKKRLDPRKLEIIEETIRDIHNSRACSTIASEYAELALRFQEEWPELTRKQVERKMPSRITYYRAVASYDAYQRFKSRCNSEQHRKGVSSGGAIDYPNIIGGVMQIDSTRVNVHIKVAGVKMGYRPWLTVLIDLLTRVITGWHLSLSPPSSLAVSRVILMSSTEHPTARRTIPITLFHDNGAENKNHAISQLASDIGFDLQPGAPHYPNHQAHVESNFSSIESRLIHLMGGSTFGKLAQDRPYSSERNPVYDLATLRSRIEEYIEIYHTTPHSGIHNMAPYQRWDVALKERLNAPETLTEEFATSLGLISVNRTINDGRVSVFGLKWKSPNLSTLGMQLQGENRKAKVYVNPTNLGMVYVSDPRNPHNKFPAYAVNPTYQNDLCLDDHERIKEMFSDFSEAYQDAHQSLMMLGHFYRKLRDDASRTMEKIDGKKVKNIRDFTESENYRMEILEEYAQENLIPETQEMQDRETITSPFATR